MPLPACLDTLHRASTARHDRRLRRRTLERELAAFTTAAELSELAALLEAAPESAAGPIRDILERQAMTRLVHRGTTHLFRTM